jgi:hypothetical protein
MDTYHCFGSRWFCLQMQEAFDGQARILGELSRTEQEQEQVSVLTFYTPPPVPPTL